MKIRDQTHSHVLEEAGVAEYVDIKDGRVLKVNLDKKYLVHICCDCQLAHQLDIKWEKPYLVMQFYRDEETTKWARAGCEGDPPTVRLF